MRNFHFLLLLLSVFLLSSAYTQVLINEIQSKNSQSITDEDGDSEDWIELYNAGSLGVNLEGWVLADSNPEQNWTFPAVTIEAGGFLLVFASSKNRVTPLLHCSFKLSSTGEAIHLFNSDGQIQDSYTAVALSSDRSYGRLNDGGEEKGLFYLASPQSSNQESVLANTLTVSHAPGFYTDEISLSASGSSDGDIHYTLDYTEPTIDDPIWSGQLALEVLTNAPNSLSQIPTTPLEGALSLQDYIWKEPMTNGKNCHVVKFRSFINGVPNSDATANSYFVGPEYAELYSVPVVSLSMNSEDLFNYETGMYVPGIYHEESLPWDSFWPSGNHSEEGPEWGELVPC